MVGIPPVLDADAEDVAWALQTAEALWKRNERVDAIVWLRRAAQAAGEAEDDDRALALARSAAELAEVLAHAAQPASVHPPSEKPESTDAVEDLLRRSQVEIEVAVPVSLPGEAIDLASVEDTISPDAGVVPPPHATPPPPVAESAPATPAPISAPAPVATPAADSTAPMDVVRELPPPDPDVLTSTEQTLVPLVSAVPPPPPRLESPSSDESPITPPVVTPSPEVHTRPRSVPDAEPRTAAEAHAGMLDPWADAEKPTARRDGAVPDVARAALDIDQDVVTSAPPPAMSAKSAPPPPQAPPAPPVPRRPPPLPPRAKPSVPALDAPAPPPPAPAPAAAPPAAPPPAPPPPAPAPAAAPPAPAPAAHAAAVPVAVLAADGALDLTVVEAFADLPDDAREAFARAAKVETLARDEEVSSFALVLVLEGSVDVAATIVEAPALRLDAGAVLRARGTLDHRVPLRLLCASETAKVATWNDDAVDEAFRSCSWVEDDLRAAGDRAQALVGVTMGALGERLDADLRAQVTGRLTLRVLHEGEVCAEQGKPVPGLVVVAAGELELVHDDVVGGSLGSGEFVFASEVLGAGRSPATARAGKGGALVMSADRQSAQELLVTCPPLLEIFAGM